MDAIDLDSSVPDILIEHPELFELLRALGVECTCGGKSLGTACRERGLDPLQVVQQCGEILSLDPRSDFKRTDSPGH